VLTAVLELAGAVTVTVDPDPEMLKVLGLVDQLYVLDPVDPAAVYTWLVPGHT